MRTFYLFLFTILYGTGYSQTPADTLMIAQHQKLKEIPTCIGVNCLSGESCSTGVPAGSSAAYLMHENITIGKIKKCKMICDLPGGICSKMTFILEGAESVTQAGKQAAKQFGEATYTKEGNKFIYSWIHTPEDQPQLNIRLEVSADIQSGMMYIK